MIPSGLSLQEEVITIDKEHEIITWLDSREWSNKISRRTQHYGYEYNYGSKDIMIGPKLEGPILDIANLITKAGLMKPNQCIVNEYYRNQGIAPHIDSNIFDCLLPRRLLMMMQGDARYKWKHGISKNITYMKHGTKITKYSNYRRISLTYRKVNNK